MLPIRGSFFLDCSGTLCVLFSFNTQGNALTDALKPLQCPTIKPLSDTRWEARYDALHAQEKVTKRLCKASRQCVMTMIKNIKLKKKPGVLFNQ